MAILCFMNHLKANQLDNGNKLVSQFLTSKILPYMTFSMALLGNILDAD